jgi:hypothetical protein
MCMSSPNIPPPPPPPQEAKAPDAMAARRKTRPAGGMGTMLTGPSGVSSGALSTGGTSLLGG